MKRTVSRIKTYVIAVMVVLPFLVTGIETAGAQDKAEAQGIVDNARVTFNAFMRDEKHPWLRENFKNAKGVLIYPQVLKAGFILGGSGGTGVFLVKDPDTGTGASRRFTRWVPSHSVFRSAVKRLRP